MAIHTPKLTEALLNIYIDGRARMNVLLTQQTDGTVSGRVMCPMHPDYYIDVAVKGGIGADEKPTLELNYVVHDDGTLDVEIGVAEVTFSYGKYVGSISGNNPQNTSTWWVQQEQDGYHYYKRYISPFTVLVKRDYH